MTDDARDELRGVDALLEVLAEFSALENPPPGRGKPAALDFLARAADDVARLRKRPSTPEVPS